jgi:hypothetical protein
VWVEVPLQASVLQGPYLLPDTWNEKYSFVNKSKQILIQCLNITRSLSPLKLPIRMSQYNKHSKTFQTLTDTSHYYSLHSCNIWNAIHRANLRILKSTLRQGDFKLWKNNILFQVSIYASKASPFIKCISYIPGALTFIT